MKVLLVNGSPHKEGCTYTALKEVEKELNAAGVETEIFWLGIKPISGCLGNEAMAYLMENGVVVAPSKAVNAGGVSVSGLEMTQNSMRYSWSREEVDAKLKDIMKNIYESSVKAAKEFGMEGNLVAGANIAGFIKVAEAMLAQGVC